MTLWPVSARLDQLRDLADQGLIPITPAVLSQLESPPRLVVLELDRIEGMLLGLAVGDALGNTTEGLTPAERRRRFGEIRDYLPNQHAGGARVGLPSDDTQLASWTLEHVLRHDGVVPEGLAKIFASRRIFGIGRTVRAFLAASRTDGPGSPSPTRSLYWSSCTAMWRRSSIRSPAGFIQSSAWSRSVVFRCTSARPKATSVFDAVGSGARLICNYTACDRLRTR
jgi:hypothetical protein